MPSFTYMAREAQTGREVLSSLDASTVEDAINALLKRDLLVVNIEEKSGGKKVGAGSGKVSLKDRVVFTRQLATMLDAGIAMVSCLKGLAKQTRNKMMRDVINDVCRRIETGESLSDAMAHHPKVFDKLYLCLVGAGEKGGLLAEVLARLATHLENSERLQRKVKSALMYPIVVTVVAIGITIFLLVKVVPVFSTIFASFNGKLPTPTLCLIAVSNFFQHWLLLILPAMVGAVYGWLHFIKTKPGREFWDKHRIRIPVFGNIAHSICLARFAHTFSSLVHSGVPILSLLEIVSRACGNVVMEKALLAARDDIQLGEGISDSLGKHPDVFPDMIVRMMAAGEQTGKIDEMMERIAKALDEEVESVLSGLTALIEPILVVVLGIMVGGIAICMFLPIFKLSDLVSGAHH
jgi:type IV pilus assembly protein PilC